MGCPKVYTPEVGGRKGECDYFMDARCVRFSANCNDEVVSIESVILAMQENIKKLQARNTGLERKVSKAEEKVTDLMTAVRGFKEEIKDLKIKITLQ
jgi:predicted  nucleic acid-binding Zn-ribbon protein